MTNKPKMKIGKYLVSKGLLSVEEERNVAEIQKKLGPDSNEKFGQIAMKVGYVSSKALKQAVKEKREQQK